MLSMHLTDEYKVVCKAWGEGYKTKEWCKTRNKSGHE